MLENALIDIYIVEQGRVDVFRRQVRITLDGLQVAGDRLQGEINTGKNERHGNTVILVINIPVFTPPRVPFPPWE